MMSRARFTETYKRLTGIARKVYDAVPEDDWHTAQRIYATMEGSHNFAVIQGCLDSLKRDDLIDENADGCFRRAAVRPPNKKREVTAMEQALAAAQVKSEPAKLQEVVNQFIANKLPEPATSALQQASTQIAAGMQQVVATLGSVKLPEPSIPAEGGVPEGGVLESVTAARIWTNTPTPWPNDILGQPMPRAQSNDDGTVELVEPPITQADLDKWIPEPEPTPPTDPLERLEALAHELKRISAVHQTALSHIGRAMADLSVELLIKQEADAKAAAKLKRLLQALDE